MLRLVRLARPALERGLVYGGNGLLLLVLAAAMPPADLGIYFSLQAMLEVAVLIATANSGTWISVNMGAAHRGLFLAFIVRLWPVALLAGLGVAAGAYYVAEGEVWLTVAAIAVALAANTGAALLLSLVRGRGHVSWFVVEPSLRALFSAAAIGTLWLLGRVQPFEAILANAAAALFTSIVTCFLLKRPRLQVEGGLVDGAEYEAPSLFRGTLSGVVLYIARKGDILLLVPVLAAPQLAAYKVAFLLAELPLQVFQVVVNRRLREVASGHSAGRAELLNGFYVAYLKWAVAWAVLVALALPFVPIEGILIWFVCLAIGQGVRGMALLHEIGYLGTGRYNIVSLVATSVAVVKLAAIAAIAHFAPAYIAAVPVLSALWELLAYTVCFRYFGGLRAPATGSSTS